MIKHILNLPKKSNATVLVLECLWASDESNASFNKRISSVPLFPQTRIFSRLFHKKFSEFHGKRFLGNFTRYILSVTFFPSTSNTCCKNVKRWLRFDIICYQLCLLERDVHVMWEARPNYSMEKRTRDQKDHIIHWGQVEGSTAICHVSTYHVEKPSNLIAPRF